MHQYRRKYKQVLVSHPVPLFELPPIHSSMPEPLVQKWVRKSFSRNFFREIDFTEKTVFFLLVYDLTDVDAGNPQVYYLWRFSKFPQIRQLKTIETLKLPKLDLRDFRCLLYEHISYVDIGYFSIAEKKLWY